MQILSGMPGNRHRAGLRRVMILAMAAARADMKPAVVFNLPDDFPDFHFAGALSFFRLKSRNGRRSPHFGCAHVRLSCVMRIQSETTLPAPDSVLDITPLIEAKNEFTNSQNDFTAVKSS